MVLELWFFFFKLSVVQLLGNLWWGFAELFCEETDSQLYKNLCWMIWTSQTTFHCLLNLDCPSHLIVSSNPVYHLWLDWLHWANFYWTTHRFTNYLLGNGSHSTLGFVGDSGVAWSCLLQWKQNFCEARKHRVMASELGLDAYVVMFDCLWWQEITHLLRQNACCVTEELWLNESS